MGLIQVGICGVAAYLLNQGGAQVLFYMAVVNAVANLWSYGIVHNFTNDPMSAPDSWTVINMLTTFLGIGLLIYSFFL